jgi:chorismate mutase
MGMPVQTNKRTSSVPQDLELIRSEIDALDDRILDLIERRLAISAAIAASKEAQNGDVLKLRPRREAAIIERLAARSQKVPPELVAQVWRTLMSHSLQAQTRTEIVICAAADSLAVLDSVRARFGPAAAIRWVAEPEAAIAAAREGDAIAVIHHHISPVADPAVLPFEILENPDASPLARLMGRVAPEDALDDRCDLNHAAGRLPEKLAQEKKR